MLCAFVSCVFAWELVRPFAPPLTFSGAFLTLDRTRTFVPRGDTVKPLPGAYGNESDESGWKKWLHVKWVLQGGVGGLAGGYAFGRE